MPLNGRFDWLISEHQSVNPSREANSSLSGKYKGSTLVHPVTGLFLFASFLSKVHRCAPLTLTLNGRAQFTNHLLEF